VNADLVVTGIVFGQRIHTILSRITAAFWNYACVASESVNSNMYASWSFSLPWSL